MSITGCECPAPGWCGRHQCEKPPWAWQMCRCQPAVFEAWESGRGMMIVMPPTEPEPPGLWQRAVHFGGAVARHLAGGLAEVAPEVAAARLAVCETCPACDLATWVCRDPACGCFLRVKARWAQETCPRGLWPAPAADSDPESAESPE